MSYDPEDDLRPDPRWCVVCRGEADLSCERHSHPTFDSEADMMECVWDELHDRIGDLASEMTLDELEKIEAVCAEVEHRRRLEEVDKDMQRHASPVRSGETVESATNARNHSQREADSAASPQYDGQLIEGLVRAVEGSERKSA